MKRAGATALAGSGLLLPAFAFDARTLFVPALALLALAGVSVVWVTLAAWGASVHRSFDLDTVVEEQPVEARIQLGAGPLGLPGAEILDPLAGGALRVATGWARRVELRVVTKFPTRGRVSLAAPRLRVRDPLGLSERVLTGSASSHEVLVLPRTERVRWAAEARAGKYALGRAITREPVGASDPDGLRQYRPGTPASRIHWPALARGAGLLERRLLPDGEQSPLVALDASTPASPALLDAAVRAAASLVLALARQGGCDLLLPGQRRPWHVTSDLAAWPGAHARLALVEGGPGTPAPQLAARPRQGVIFYVAAHPLTRLPALAAGAAGTVLVLPDELATASHAPSLFGVSGCVGWPVEIPRRPGARIRAAA